MQEGVEGRGEADAEELAEGDEENGAGLGVGGLVSLVSKRGVGSGEDMDIQL